MPYLMHFYAPIQIFQTLAGVRVDETGIGSGKVKMHPKMPKINSLPIIF
jgi:hypothetical protein